MHENEISEKIIGAAIEVHRILGPVFMLNYCEMEFVESSVIYRSRCKKRCELRNSALRYHCVYHLPI
jgi:hypothetical protein